VRDSAKRPQPVAYSWLGLELRADDDKKISKIRCELLNL
jgi:hypothetical protein